MTRPGRTRHTHNPAPRDPDPATAGTATAVFLAQNLEIGGAERVFVHLVNHVRGVDPVPVLVQTAAPLARDLEAKTPLTTLSTADGRFPEDGARSPWLSRLLDRCDEYSAGQAISIPIKALRLRRIVRARRARLVCTFLPKAHTIAALARSFGLRDAVFVANVHCFMSQHIHYQFPAPTRFLARAVLGAALRRADAVIAVAHAVRDDLIRTLRLDPARVHVVPNPMDLDRIRAAAGEPVSTEELMPAPGAFTVVAAGRLVRLKAYDVLVEAVARLRDLPVRIVFVGDGPERPALERLARRLDLHDRVHFVGAQTNPWRFMAVADVLVHPSRTEAFPNVFGEAMVLGVSVIATDCSPGVREYLEDGESGVIVPTDDVAALAGAIRTLAADQDVRQALIQSGERRIEPFGLGPAIAAHAELLSRLARRS